MKNTHNEIQELVMSDIPFTEIDYIDEDALGPVVKCSMCENHIELKSDRNIMIEIGDWEAMIVSPIRVCAALCPDCIDKHKETLKHMIRYNRFMLQSMQCNTDKMIKQACKECGSTDFDIGYDNDGNPEECFCKGCGADLTQPNAIGDKIELPPSCNECIVGCAFLHNSKACRSILGLPERPADVSKVMTLREHSELTESMNIATVMHTSAEVALNNLEEWFQEFAHPQLAAEECTEQMQNLDTIKDWLDASKGTSTQTNAKCNHKWVESKGSLFTEVCEKCPEARPMKEES